MGNRRSYFRIRPIFTFLVMLCLSLVFAGLAAGQSGVDVTHRFRVGEKLSYNVSFGKFSNSAYLETAVISRGKLSGQDVVELRSTLKTLGFVSATVFPFDEVRTVYAAPDTGLPLYISRVVNSGVEPKETVENFLKEPTANFDLLTLIYKARDAKGSGTFPLNENGQHYTVTFQSSDTEKIKAEAGDFDTVVSVVQSDYLTANGIKELKINFVDDEYRVPALIRIKSVKGLFTASIAAIQLPKPPPVVTTPLPVQTPIAALPPPAKATPTPYIDNQPISPELGFALGENLTYNVSEGAKQMGVIALAAKERKMFQGEDSLLLRATVISAAPGNNWFHQGDFVQVQVDPETLAPRLSETRFTGDLKWLNQSAVFDAKTGNILVGKADPVDAPIGTQTILSLIYGMRSFNLKPSKDPKAPVNDTRVAVFWESRPYVFVLRPTEPEDITIGGDKIPAQMIVVTTGNEMLDKQTIKVWLSANERVPLRFTFGPFQADLITPQKNSTK